MRARRSETRGTAYSSRMQTSTDSRQTPGAEARDGARPDRAANPDDGDDAAGEYRGHRFALDVLQHGRVWTAQYRLLDVSLQQAPQAAAAGRQQWKSMDPAWRTVNEARNNAIEAAHAAIDALYQ